MSLIKTKIIKHKDLLKGVDYLEKVVNSLKIGSIFQSLRWGLTLHNVFGYEIYLLLTYGSNSEVVASLLFLRDKYTGIVFCIDGPCLSYPDRQLVDSLVRACKRVAYALRAKRLEFRLLPGLETSESLQVLSFRGIKYIDKPLGEIWRSFSKKSHVRYGVKRAIRLGVKIYEARSFQDYLEHIKLSYESKIHGGMSPHTPENRNLPKIIKNIAFYLRENHKLFLARVDDKIIATALWLYSNSRAYYYDVGMDREYKEYYAPYYLMWYSIEKLRLLGVKVIDLMKIDMSSSKSFFKRKYSDKILPNKGFRTTKPSFFWLYMRRYPYAIRAYKMYASFIFKYRVLNLISRWREKWFT